MSAIEALAARCGIEPGFTDARGETQTTGVATQRALLAAMGLAVGTDAEAQGALRALERQDWECVVPPVIVSHPDEALSVDVHVQRSCDAVSWSIALERGGELRGSVPRDESAVIDRHDPAERPLERRRLVLPVEVPFGYHRLRVDGAQTHTSLIVTPGKCWLPPAVQGGRRLWGISAQLYLLRSARNWGIGDYGDLRRLVELCKRRGADVVGLNPLHALFPDDPERASPYSPASRLLLNVLNIDVEAVPEFAHCPKAQELVESTVFRQALMACRDARLVKYSQIADLKMQVLRILFTACRMDRGGARWREFEEFRRRAALPLERGCLFLALREHFAAEPSSRADWRTWPAAFQDPGSSAVAEFAAAHATLVTFHAWLQFVADAQLAAVAEACKSMAVGLYRDLAVGADPTGVEPWCSQAAVVRDAAIGAPPDIYNPQGQNWGLPPFNPHALRAEGYRSFIDLIRANMRHAGGLRIDHVMALQRLYWIPGGRAPADGGFVRYPLRDLLGILALESQRNRCLVVGEDLGTVPKGLRECLAQANVLSYRVLLFERDQGGYLAPAAYPSLAVAVAGSHDLPTLRSWWTAADLELKEKLGLFPRPQDRELAWSERRRDRADLLEALRRAGLEARADMDIETLVRVAHAFLARTESALALVQLDDITDESAPVNVPTTSTEYPNWRRRLSLTLDQLVRHPRLAALAQILREERGAPAAPSPAGPARRPRRRVDQRGH